MTDTGLGMGAVFFGLAVLSILDYVIVAGCVWAAARIFRYQKNGWKTPSKIALYSLKYGLAVLLPFTLAIFLSGPSVEEILSKGLRLLLPLGFSFIVKTTVILPEMKKAYGESLKRSMYGYATAVYLMFVAWLTVVMSVSLLIGLSGLLSAGGYEGADDGALTGWWDLQPVDDGTYNASAKTFSVLYVNGAGEPIKISAGQALDAGSETDCNITSPAQSQEVDTGDSFDLNATCAGSNTQPGEPYGVLVQIHYATLNNPIAPLHENGYFSGNSSM